jgi:hypothetical protein
MEPPPMSKTVLQVLIEAKELLSDPSRWTKGGYARDKLGHKIGPRNDAACSWCIEGALTKVCESDRDLKQKSTNCLEECVVLKDLIYFNDAHLTTHQRVIALFDEAIIKIKI